jgi:hypothetical protein
MNTIPLIPRIEDLPYNTSPPIEFVYQSTATVSAGLYSWTDVPSSLIPDRPLIVNAVYYFRSITMSATCEEADFTTNITVIPQFNMYLKSRARVILFREPIYMVKYFQNFDYRLAWTTQQVDDQLLAAFSLGTVYQGSGLVGKQTLTLTVVISAQEIVDENFIAQFRKQYADGRIS